MAVQNEEVRRKSAGAAPRRRMESPGRARKDASHSSRGEAAPPFFIRHSSFFIPRALLLFALTVLVYLPSFRNGFIWDDDAMVWNNPLIKAPDGLARFWFSTEAPDYFPLVSSLLWAEWRLFGMNPAGYHVVQVLLHAGAAVLLWRVLRRLDVPGAWWAGLIFAVHPVNVETVAWITETKNTLPMGLYLASLLFYLRFDECGRKRDYALSLGAFVLALLGKTSVVMLPFLVLGIGWWRRGRISRADLVRSTPFFASALVLGLVTVWFQSNRAIISTVIREDSLLSRLLIAGRAVWFYLYKALVPGNLSFVYPRWELETDFVLGWASLAALAAVVALAWMKRASWGRGVLAGSVYYVLSLLPVLGFVNIYFMRYSLVADHWQYVAIPGVIAAVVGGIAHATRNLPAKPVGLLAAGGVLLLSGLTWSAQRSYSDNETLFQDVLKKNPRAWIAHNNLGWMLFEKQRPGEAERHFRTALDLNPGLADAHRNLGVLYASQGRDAEAMESFRSALREGEDARARDALGTLYLRQGRTEEARAEFEKAAALRPDFAPAHFHLGEVHAQKKEWPRAAESYREAVRLNPSNPDYGHARARSLAGAGRPAEAIAELKRVVQTRPDYAAAYSPLAALLARQGCREEAAAVLRQAALLDPSNSGIQADLARLEGR